MNAAIRWAGEDLVLLPERAMWWPGERTLFIADPHFGKASAFRSAGIPVPELAHADDLARLESILRRTGARRLVVLGDFFHARRGRTAATLDALAAWRERSPDLEITLVLGNHDRHAGPPPPEWKIDCVRGPHAIAPFQCRHEPPESAGGFVLCGHIHPAIRLGDAIGGGVGGPCFHFGARIATLPAFGTFTGTCRIKADPGDRIFIIGPDVVVELGSLSRARKTHHRHRKHTFNGGETLND